MRRTIVKEGPLVFIKRVLIMEILAAVALYILSFLENYEMLYRRFGADDLLRYDIFLVSAFSSLQLIYISIIFFDWYFSYFEIGQKEIVRKSGLLFRRKQLIRIADITSIETYESPIGRLMKHSTIILHQNGNKKTKMRNVSNAEEYLSIIKQALRHNPNKNNPRRLSEILSGGENLFTEFKESLRYDKRKMTTNRDLEKAATKTLVAFLNTEGGILVIGANNEGDAVGLKDDFETLPKKNRDGFENHLTQLIKTQIGVHFLRYIDIKFERIESKDICVISVSESHKPAYLKNGADEEFFVRVGNSTHPLSMSEAEEYIKTHWEE